jgi:hypothetical protein
VGGPVATPPPVQNRVTGIAKRADPAHTDHILRQGKALVRAIEALSTIDPSGLIERAAAAGRGGGCASERIGAHWG